MTQAGPSATGARLTGDDLQHLIVWYWCLKAYVDGGGIEAVGVEVADTGRLDDLVVYYRNGTRRHAQVKASTTAVGLVNVAWLTAKKKKARSIIQALYESWVALERPDDGVELLTSRPIDPNDEMLALLDRSERIGPRLRQSTARVTLGERDRLAEHLGVDADELLAFFEVVQIKVGQTEALWRDRVDDAAMAAGLRVGADAQAIGLSVIREWVKDTREPRPAAQLRSQIDELGLRAGTPRSIVVVEAIDRVPSVSDASAHIDWLHSLRGDSPRTRRGAVDPADWNGRFADELSALRDSLRADGTIAVAVRGAMRLPMWFGVGEALADVAGFDIAAVDRGEAWNPGPHPAVELQVVADEQLGEGPDTVLVVEVSNTGWHDVREAFAEVSTVGRLVSVTVDGGPDRRLLRDGPHALASAAAVRDWVRREVRAEHLHLVLVANGPFALFLGHLWDRVPPTSIYEDLAPGYESAFTVANSSLPKERGGGRVGHPRISRSEEPPSPRNLRSASLVRPEDTT